MPNQARSNQKIKASVQFCGPNGENGPNTNKPKFWPIRCINCGESRGEHHTMNGPNEEYITICSEFDGTPFEELTEPVGFFDFNLLLAKLDQL